MFDANYIVAQEQLTWMTVHRDDLVFVYPKSRISVVALYLLLVAWTTFLLFFAIAVLSLRAIDTGPLLGLMAAMFLLLSFLPRLVRPRTGRVVKPPSRRPVVVAERTKDSLPKLRIGLRMRWWLIGTGALMIVGSLLPWASVEGITVTGVEWGDGFITLIAAAVLLAVGVANRAGLATAIATMVSAGFSIFVVLINLLAEWDLGNVRAGLYLTMIAASIGLFQEFNSSPESGRLARQPTTTWTFSTGLSPTSKSAVPNRFRSKTRQLGRSPPG
jgi:hypothetical protein